jgi:hypothetical protein
MLKFFIQQYDYEKQLSECNIMNLNLPLTHNHVQPTASDRQEKAFRATLFTGVIVFVLAVFGFTPSLIVGAAAWISFMLFAPSTKSPESYESVTQHETSSTAEPPVATPVRRETGSKMVNPMREWVMEVASVPQE